MRTRTLKLLGLVVLIALAAAWWMSRDDAAPANDAAGGKFLDGYREKINEIVKIEVDDGDEPLVVEKRGSGWVDSLRGGYPVKADEVKRLLVALNGLERKEAKTSNPQLHGKLQLALEGDEEARGKVLRVWTAGAEAPAWEFVVGMPKWTPVRGIYLRGLHEDQCWFVTGELQLPYAPTAWLDKEIANVNQLDVARMTLVRGAVPFTISRPDSDTPWALAEMPAERTLKDPSPFNQLANALGYLNFDDVATADDARFARDPDLTAEFECFNGVQLRLTGWLVEERLWARIEASPPTVVPAPPPLDPEADQPQGPQDGPRGPSAETIAQWSAKWPGWVYLMPDWKAKSLAQGLEDWLVPLPSEEPQPDAGAELPPEPVEEPVAPDEEGDGE
jgi:hypothetical protein